MQLKDQIKCAIATGRLRPGEQLPTVRQLAVELRINPNTVSRVYSELEREGLLATRQGKGSFVQEKNVVSPALPVLEKLIDGLLVRALEMGFTIDQVLGILQKKVKEAEPIGPEKGKRE